MKYNNVFVNQALDRINPLQLKEIQELSQKSKEDKNFIFSDLKYLFTREFLHGSLNTLNNPKAVGVDNIPIKKFKHGHSRESDIDTWIQTIIHGTYKVDPALERLAIINSKERIFKIPTVKDKVIQKVISIILSAIFDPLFTNHTFGYRPGDRWSHKKALNQAKDLFRQSKLHYIIDIDIKDFFGSIDKEILLSFISKRVTDRTITRIISDFFNAGTINWEDDYYEANRFGINQGSPLSPVLANIYMHYIYDDWFYKSDFGNCGRTIRYADDIIVGIRNLSQAENFINQLKIHFAVFNISLSHKKPKTIIALDDIIDKNIPIDFLGYSYYISSLPKNFRHMSTRKVISVISDKKIEQKKQEFLNWLTTRAQILNDDNRLSDFRYKLQYFCNYYKDDKKSKKKLEEFKNWAVVEYLKEFPYKIDKETLSTNKEVME